MDIVICTYNNADLLDQSLAALASQKFSASCDWSVVVVDNNCNDHTANVVDKYIVDSNIPNIRRIVETQQGLSHARLCGINNTNSDWIAFVDDDCLLAQDWIEEATQFLGSHPQCGAFGGKVILQWAQSPSPTLIKHQHAFAACDRGETEKELSRKEFHIPGAGLVVNRQALVQSGWLEKQYLTGRNGSQLTAGDDSEIVLRILNAGYEIWYTPTCVLNHLIQARRISEKYLSKVSYGLGLAAPYIAIFQWRHSYLYWLTFSIVRAIKYLLATLGHAISAIWDSEQRKNVQIEWSWAKGQLDSLLSLLAMPKQERVMWLSLFE